MKLLADFLEVNIENIDIREVYMINDKTKAISNLLWNLLLLPFNFLSPEFNY